MTSIRTFGIDISSYSKTIDWNVVTEKLNPRFVLARAAYVGKKDLQPHTDALFADEYWPALGKLKMPRGAYVFCRPKADADDTINAFFSVYTPKKGDLLPTLDIEDDYDDDAGVTVEQRIAQIEKMVGLVSARIGGQKPMIYTKARVWKDLGNPKQFSDCPLWVIDYDGAHAEPTLPPPWPTFAFWQYDHDLTADGIEGDYDPDYFNGTEAKLGECSIK